MRKITIQRTIVKTTTDEKGKEVKVVTKPYLVVSINQGIPPSHRAFQSCIGGLC